MKQFVLITFLVLTVGLVAPTLYAGDDYEQEADRVSDTVRRPAPVMRNRAGTANQAARSAAQTVGSTKVETGAGSRAINRDDCNPLCGMKGVGQEQSQPAQ
ncbi:MAG: hypothetical protein OQL27_11215 [Sedimenticola sp.]|nr:hypothetical protein [Sedimenticola sp.]